MRAARCQKRNSTPCLREADPVAEVVVVFVVDPAAAEADLAVVALAGAETLNSASQAGKSI